MLDWILTVLVKYDKNITPFKIGLNGKMKIDKNASNQKMNATFYNQLFKMYNFVAWPKKIRSL